MAHRCSSELGFQSRTLIDYIEGGHSLQKFLDDFPTVTRELAVAALEQAKAHLIADARVA